MVDFSENPAFYNRIIPKEKLLETDSDAFFQVEDVTWIMSIKPGIRNVTSYVNTRQRMRMEEIEVLRITGELYASKDFLAVARSISKKILYPCVLIFGEENRYKFVTWSFLDSVKQPDKSIATSFYESTWIREPFCSERTKRCAETVFHILLHGEGSIRDLFQEICSSILACSPKFLGSRAHLQRILYALIGKKSSPVMNRIEGTLHHYILNPHQRYQKNVYSDNYRYFYEYEDVWHAFMNDEQLRGIIEKRRFRDMEDLVYCVDAQYEAKN